MSEGLDIIGRLPFELAAGLEGDDWFSDIPVIVAEEGSVKQQMERKQAVITSKGGHRGAGVIVLPTLAEDLRPNVRFGPMTLYPTFQTIENLELNRDANGTGKPARVIARRIRDVIKQYQIQGLITNLAPETPCITSVDLSRELGDLVKSCLVRFSCLECPSDSTAFVAMPAATIADGWVTISCDTAGAEIWFTTDGSSPLPAGRRDSTAMLYARPIAVSAGMVVRARAFVAGSVPSGVIKIQS
jgi:hypothetical protein